MILYKNVDICDLESIIEHGILSADKAGNNWQCGNRADNATDVVYLFAPKEQNRCFPEYGAALLVCDIEAKQTVIPDGDRHGSEYTEYVADMVPVDAIKKILIPELFRKKISLSAALAEKIIWCDMEAKIYSDDDEKIIADSETLKRFSETAKIYSSNQDMYFRGTDNKNRVFDIYDVKYIEK